MPFVEEVMVGCDDPSRSTIVSIFGGDTDGNGDDRRLRSYLRDPPVVMNISFSLNASKSERGAVQEILSIGDKFYALPCSRLPANRTTLPPVQSHSLFRPSFLSLSSSPSFAMSSPDARPKGHSRHDTALIHGLSASEVQKLSEACVEAKRRAYCKSISLPII